MKQRQQHVTKPIIHEKGPMYLSVVQRRPLDHGQVLRRLLLAPRRPLLLVRRLLPVRLAQVYNAPDGKKVLASGTPSGQFVEMC